MLRGPDVFRFHEKICMFLINRNWYFNYTSMNKKELLMYGTMRKSTQSFSFQTEKNFFSLFVFR